MTPTKLQWGALGCSAPYVESVTARLSERGLLADEEEATGRPLLVVMCDRADRWDELDQATSNPETVVVAVLPALELDGYVRALSAGADGVVYADTPSSITADVVQAAAQGEVLLPKQAAHAMACRAQRESPSVEVDAIQLELLRSLSEGRTVVEMATRLHYSERTVRRYLQSLYLRLGVRNRAEAIAAGGRMGLVDPP